PRSPPGCSAFRLQLSAVGRGGEMRVVLVLGGGGAKSLAHAGAWKALREANIGPSHIIGTSMGAVIGAALAAGSSHERILEIALSLGKKDFAALDAWSLAKGVTARSRSEEHTSELQ